MPNYKLSTTLKDHLISNANKLCDKRELFSAGDFPLTTAQLQAAIMPPEQLTHLRALAASGVQDLPKHQRQYLLLHRDDLPLLLRTCVVLVNMPEEIYAQRGTYYRSGDSFNKSDPDFLVPDWSVLDAGDRDDLAEWANNLVKATRHSGVVNYTVRLVLDNCLSVGHVQAWWPMLGTLITDKDWKTRFRNGPRDLRNYAPMSHHVGPAVQLIKASEVILSSAQLLGEYTHPTGTIQATLARHQPLPNDRKF